MSVGHPHCLKMPFLDSEPVVVVASLRASVTRCGLDTEAQQTQEVVPILKRQPGKSGPPLRATSVSAHCFLASHGLIVEPKTGRSTCNRTPLSELDGGQTNQGIANPKVAVCLSRLTSVLCRN